MRSPSAAAPESISERAARLHREVSDILQFAESWCRDCIPGGLHADPDALASVQNFVAYLGVRRRDIRTLQRELHRLGLSSLGRSETHTLDSLAAAATLLARLCGAAPPELSTPRLLYDAGERILAQRTEALLGPRSARYTPRIMVTMPPETATHYELVRELIAAGMQVSRINCAHDSPAAWAAMVANVRRAAAELGRRCAIFCDLPGPKLRTGPIETGPGVVRWHAFKDDYGKVVAPARIWLSAGAAAPDLAHARVPVAADFVAQLQAGDEVHFRDHQGRARWVVVTAVQDGGAWADGARGAFVTEGIQLRARRGGADLDVRGSVGALPRVPRELFLRTGDTLLLTPESVAGRPALLDERGAIALPAQIGCSLLEVFRDARPGERVFLDDGKIAGVIEAVEPERIRVKVTWTRGPRARLAEDKGINLPDSALNVPSLTDADMAALDFAAQLRDQIEGVGLSFVRHADDVAALYGELDRRAAGHFGVILKIETASAFQNLPGIVLSALRRNKVGMMIARGDLGVEVGFERMAELQEEIGSLCAAAHLPVVWATQVLETLAKKGMPSRAEVSDVVLAARTQCVMLNKGPHLAAAIRFLADVLERMEGHQDKHFRLMRALRVAALQR